MSAGPDPATMADWLAKRTDDELLALLEARPDVSVPPPPDFDVLARRLSAAPSVVRALERVDRFGLEVLEAIALLGRTVAVDALASEIGVPVPDVEDALDRLRRLGLVWGEGAVALPAGVADEIGPRPLGIGRPLQDLAQLELLPEERRTIADNLGLAPDGGVRATAQLLAGHFADPGELAGLLAGLDSRERGLLDQLADGSPIGFAGAPVPVVPLDAAPTALARLVARGLLVPLPEGYVELPREVSEALAAARADDTDGLLGRLHPRPPELTGPVVDLGNVDNASATAAAEVLRHLEALITRWEEAPPQLTRSGGVPVRELRATAKALDLPVDITAVLIELARAGSLLAETAGMETSVLPTEYVDDWRTLPAEQRWAVVAAGWLAMDVFPGLATSVQPERPDVDPQGGEATKPLPAFSWELRRPGAAIQRREVLDVLAGSAPGLVADRTSVIERLAWANPRRSDVWRRVVVTWTLSEAELLGITGRGALAGAGRALLADGQNAAAAALASCLPPPVDHLLIQGDLTAVAPGPLEPMLAREIGLVADVESAGAATVFRFSEASIRRALDAGWTGADVRDLVTRCARGTVPQSLFYLVDDVARRHGRLRVGSIASYVRCEDPALLAEVVAARRTTSVHLRAVAPTVAVSASPVDRVLEVLRGAGYAPAGEGPDGAVRIERPPAERVPVPVRRAGFGTGVPREHLASTVLRLRRAETAARAARTRAPRPPAAEAVRAPGAVLTVLAEAVADGRALEMSYVNQEGRASTRVVHPLLLSGGYLTAYDEESGERRTFAASRISQLVVLDDPS